VATKGISSTMLFSAEPIPVVPAAVTVLEIIVGSIAKH
tara:strand:- start:1229 stop:1342 length:114 start_codon:yes stop_codon:yes gene_type:complete